MVRRRPLYNLQNCLPLREINRSIISIAVDWTSVGINFPRTDFRGPYRSTVAACKRHKFQSLTKFKRFILCAAKLWIKVPSRTSNHYRNALIKTFVFHIMCALSSAGESHAESEREFFTGRGSLSMVYT